MRENIKTQIFRLFIHFSACLFLLNCKKETTWQEKPEGNLLFSFHKPIFWRLYDSVKLSFRTSREFCSGYEDYSVNISNNTINFNLGNFTITNCYTTYPYEFDYQFPNIKKGEYKILFNRPHRKDSAMIYFLDSIYVLKSESEEIKFEKDTIRRIMPNTIWTSLYYCNKQDSMRIDVIDSGMKALGCTSKLLTPGDYHYFYIKQDFTPARKKESPCFAVIRIYEFSGDRTKLVTFSEAMREKYDYDIYLDIYAWDKAIVW